MGHYNNLNLAMMTKGTDPFGMKTWPTPPGKEPRSSEALAEGRGNIEFPVVKKPKECSSWEINTYPMYVFVD